MSTFGKLVVTVIVVVLIALGVWYMKKGASPEVMPSPTPAVETTTSSDDTSSMMLEGSSAASLDDDMVTIDNQLKAVDQDGSKVDQGLNDKPVEQAE